MYTQELYHHGTKGQKWGVRRYQNADGSLTPEGKKRYNIMKDALVQAANGKDAKDQGPIKIMDEYRKNRNSKWGRKQSRERDWIDAKYAVSARRMLIKDYDEGIQTLTEYTGSDKVSRKMVNDFLDSKKRLTIGEVLKDYH